MALIWAWSLLPFVVAALGLLFRLVYSRKVPPIKLHQIGGEQALRIVGDFVLAQNDTDFGFPSGFFMPRMDRVETDLASGVIVVREQTLRGDSGFFSILRRLYYWAIQAVSGLVDESGGCFIAALVGGFILLPAPFIIYAGIAEAVLRYSFRSSVRLSAQTSGNDTEVNVTLRGLSALSIGDELQQAFRPAELPGRFHDLVQQSGRPTAQAAA